MNRRDFIKNTVWVSGALMMPRFLQTAGIPLRRDSRAGRTLVVIQLSGGNDGLNTVVPYENDIYYKARPKLAIPKREVVKITDNQGFNPVMAPLRKLFEEDGMSILHGVGYPNPSRSHFRSMDIWQMGSEQSLGTGWLGRYLDSQCPDCHPYHAVELNERLSMPLKGVTTNGFVMKDPRQLQAAANNPYLETLARTQEKHAEEEVDFLYKTLTGTLSSTDYLNGLVRKTPSLSEYPDTAFAKDLRQIAELMIAGADIRIYYVSLGDFDTHAGQKSKQDRLLRTYAQGVAAFTKDLKRHGLFDDTLIMTFSEFGRRVAQNASYGTDHGTANNLFLMGGKLRKPGMFNAPPSLTDLQDGDLKYAIDFRQIYTDILGNWLEADAAAILGRRFEGVGVL